MLDLSDLEFYLEDDLVGQNEFGFRDQRPSIDLRSLGYFEASRYSMLKTNLNKTLTSQNAVEQSNYLQDTNTKFGPQA